MGNKFFKIAPIVSTSTTDIHLAIICNNKKKKIYPYPIKNEELIIDKHNLKNKKFN